MVRTGELLLRILVFLLDSHIATHLYVIASCYGPLAKNSVVRATSVCLDL